MSPARPPAARIERAITVGPGVDVLRACSRRPSACRWCPTTRGCARPARAAPRTCRTDSCRAGRLGRERKLREVGERLADRRMHARGVELLPVVRHVVVRVRERPLQPLELQRCELVAARALDRLELGRARRFDGHRASSGSADARRPDCALDPVALAAQQRDRLAALVGDLDVVDAGAAGERDARRARAVSTSPSCAGARNRSRMPGATVIAL